MTAPTRYELRTLEGWLVEVFYDVGSARWAQACLLDQMSRELVLTVRRTENNDLDA